MNSRIQITTNIPLVQPAQLVLDVDADTLTAGEYVIVSGMMYDAQMNRLDSLADSIRWTIVNPVAGDGLTNLQGRTTRVTATRAYRTIMVIGTYSDRWGNNKPVTARPQFMRLYAIGIIT